jgi:hypothetical protein
MENNSQYSSEEPQLRKDPSLIYLGRQKLLADTTPDPQKEEVFTLEKIIDEYLLEIGYSNAQILGIVMNLLTVGKVRVEFRDYTDRIHLLHPKDIITSPQAADLFESYVKAKKMKEKVQALQELTGKIIIQPRR